MSMSKQRFHRERVTEIDISSAAATLNDPEFKADLNALHGYLVKISMKTLVEASCWAFPITKRVLLNDLCDRLETGQLDNIFDVSIEEISIQKVKQLIEQTKSK